MWCAGIFGDLDEATSYAEEAIGRALVVNQRAIQARSRAIPDDEREEFLRVFDVASERLLNIDPKAVVPGTEPGESWVTVEYVILDGEIRGFYLD